VKSGRLRALAITSAKPSALLPELPTVAASGLPGYEAVNTNGMFAPAKTPAAIINRLYQDSVRVINQGEMKEKLLNLGLEPVGSSPEEFAAAIKADVARTSKVIKEAGIRIE
jgi:tripartite-type tricarboxylate transporter receptor subunit TctC